MTAIAVRPLADNLPFGARIAGVNLDNVKDPDVRQQIHDKYLERGVLVFEDMEPSNEVLLALSDIFGPLQDHAMKGIPRVDQDSMPVIGPYRTG